MVKHRLGLLLQWFSKEPATSPIQAEVKAILGVLGIALDRDLLKLIILTDCQLIPRFLEGVIDCSWKAEPVSHDIKDFVSFVLECEVEWIDRHSNQAAHDLAFLDDIV